MPRPKHPIWQEHATLSQELLPYVGHGWIGIKPNVREMRGHEVVFRRRHAACPSTPSSMPPATGPRSHSSTASLFEVKDGQAALYRRMIPPSLPGLFMVGLVQPIGPTIPLVEIQARWVASVLAGETALPDAAAMQDEIRAHNGALARRYVGSARYTLEVDFGEYARQLQPRHRDRAAGSIVAGGDAAAFAAVVVKALR